MKESRRSKRVSSLIQQTLGSIISEEINESGLGMITITEVRVSVDLSQARVFYTIFSGTMKKERQKTVFESKVKFIRKRLAESIDLKHIPFLELVYDETPEKASKIEKIIKKIKEERNEG